eukprot:3096409-Pleurochrysis_carterae.AAC.1
MAVVESLRDSFVEIKGGLRDVRRARVSTREADVRSAGIASRGSILSSRVLWSWISCSRRSAWKIERT